MLVELKSMPITRAEGQRIACLAACEVPQPAISMVAIFAIRPGRPEQVMINAPSLRVLPQAAICVETLDWLRDKDGARRSAEPPQPRRSGRRGPRWARRPPGNAAEIAGPPLAGQRLRHLPPVCPAVRLSSTWSSEKLPTFWLGGNSLNVEMYLAMYSCAGTSMNTRSSRQWS